MLLCLFATSNTQVSIGVCNLSLICYAHTDNISLIILICLALRLHLLMHACVVVVSCDHTDEEGSLTYLVFTSGCV